MAAWKIRQTGQNQPSRVSPSPMFYSHYRKMAMKPMYLRADGGHREKETDPRKSFGWGIRDNGAAIYVNEQSRTRFNEKHLGGC